MFDHPVFFILPLFAPLLQVYIMYINWSLVEIWLLSVSRQNKRCLHKRHKRNSSWVWVALDPVSNPRVRGSFVVGDRSLQTAQLLIHAVVCILASGCMPMFISDQWVHR